ncbi:MAG: M48 family metalloprotease [Candidatus Omnitrophica bacterium]|nr:M48 family metalloprotease [Candidatus Omnitrophota bacterium]MBU4488144.1 M48 family metalloprotease [Candidatus Omnitrophota bacterium]MCG2704531.1 M48 family metallopeptidase [Candidatus Omnitrophota bacterium]
MKKIICAVSFILIFLLPAMCRADYNPVTGKDDLVMIGEAQEVKMGRSLAEEVEKRFGLVRDAGVQARVNEIGQRIVEVCDRPNLTYFFGVLEGKDLKKEQRYNAFALPGGYVYIFQDMVEDMKSDDELAAVLAHEVGHIVTKHSVKKLQTSIGLAGLQLLGVLSRADSRTQAESSVAIGQLMMSYSREAEFEADKLSVAYLKRAGFDPEGAVSFMDRLLDRQLKGETHRYIYFRTHPYTSERRAVINKEIHGKIEFDDYINTTDETRQAAW